LLFGALTLPRRSSELYNFQRAKGRGCDHPHAVRILARAWVRVLWRAWQDRTLYDPARHLLAGKTPA
jgi:hypothetical protein